jgi:hypothetical protein
LLPYRRLFNRRHGRAKSAKRVFALDVTAIYVFLAFEEKDVDAPNKSGHDDII